MRRRLGVWCIYLHVMIFGAYFGRVNTVDSEGGIHETTGRGAIFFGLRKLCDDEHKVKFDAQNPSPAAFATRSAASWRLHDEAVPRCRAPGEEGTTTPNECGAH